MSSSEIPNEMTMSEEVKDVEMSDATLNESPVKQQPQDEEWEKITDDGGVLKKILRKGDGWERPTKNSDVKVHYEGKLEDGTIFDSSRERSPFEFRLKAGQVIRGWDEGVATMKKGELAILKIRSDYGYGASGSPPKIPGNATLLFEVELLSWTSETDVTKDGGVMKTIIKDGEGWDKPSDGSTVTIKLKVKLSADASPVFENEALTFRVGEEEAPCEGIDRLLTSMKKHEICSARLAPKYSSGLQSVPTDSSALVEVELVELVKPKESWQMSTSEKLENSKVLKDQGNDFFKANRLSMAIKRYEKAYNMLGSDKDWTSAERDTSKAIKLACQLNLAACRLRQHEWKSARDNANKALELDSINVKALFRRAQALVELDDWLEAERDFKKALEFDAENKEILKALSALKAKQRKYNEEQKKRYQGIFG